MKTINLNLVWHLTTNEQPEGERRRVEICRGKSIFFIEASCHFHRFHDNGRLEVVAWAYLPEPKEVLADLMRANEQQNFDPCWLEFLRNNAVNINL